MIMDKEKTNIDGMKRTKIKFALFPKRLNNHQLIWLERYRSYQEYEKEYCMGGDLSGWREYKIERIDK